MEYVRTVNSSKSSLYFKRLSINRFTSAFTIFCPPIYPKIFVNSIISQHVHMGVRLIFRTRWNFDSLFYQKWFQGIQSKIFVTCAFVRPISVIFRISLTQNFPKCKFLKKNSIKVTLYLKIRID